MKRILLSAAMIIIVAAIGITSYFFGYYKAWHETMAPQGSELKPGIERRTEAYQPSCSELMNREKPSLVKNGNDCFFVHATEHYFYVVGINIDPGRPPAIHWWGADTSFALKNCKN